MRNYVYKHTLALLLLFTLCPGFTQKKYESNASETTVTLEGKNLNGYKTTFDFGWEEVRRGWWEYAREFGTPLNMKTYYKVTIPSETTDGNVDLVIYTQSSEGTGGVDFFLGLANEKYKEQALVMILNFKKEFYINDLVQKIEQKQVEADKLSDDYRDTILESEKSSLLNRLNELEGEIELLKANIKKIETS